ncbi:cysteine-rich CWC family protein [Fulvivirga ligni]|uniref:cysteine-rich CWC family protein n=1 Tax=Fulvivirga ligni TaxID=2904246 RepID=UPI001F3CEE2F|nr:cysteine-rich CWC family protein [Fulvivirga ligni]UII20583.1 cysteine-rich CWC family protein [Fulvivirga ligni]
MPRHEDKYCPRCKTLFECKVGNVSQCQCSKVDLNQEERHYLAQKYGDCLCASCMTLLKSEYNVKKYKEAINKILNGYGGT